MCCWDDSSYQSPDPQINFMTHSITQTLTTTILPLEFLSVQKEVLSIKNARNN